MTHCPWDLRCVNCGQAYPGLAVRYRCDCGGTLDVVHQFPPPAELPGPDGFDARLGSRRAADRSGVWRFRELILPVPEAAIVSLPEGNTNLYRSGRLSEWTGIERLVLKHEGENPTGSFKDRGMTVGATAARLLGMTRVACASTGNTSASMAAYAARAGMQAIVFVPEGNIAYGKLSQALAYGARTVQIAGDFDAAMTLVEQVCREEGIYLLNSVNPFRIEGQKAIAFELLQDLEWSPPDWIVLPGGNLGNSSAIGKGLAELASLGWLARMPRIAVIQAEGANPFYRAFAAGTPVTPLAGPRTVATAIRIGAPVSWQKSWRAVQASGGTVAQVTDQEIMDAKAQVDRAGIGAEPASCAAVAGARMLREQGVIAASSQVAVILTGHLLKDPDATVGYHRGELPGIAPAYPNVPLRAAADLRAVIAAING